MPYKEEQMINEAFLDEYFKDNYYAMRGLNYNEFLVEIKSEIDKENNISIKAIFQKNENENEKKLYKVVSTYTTNGDILKSQCDCPSSPPCGHEKTAMLKVIENKDFFNPPKKESIFDKKTFSTKKETNKTYTITPNTFKEEERKKLFSNKINEEDHKQNSYRYVFFINIKPRWTLSLGRQKIDQNGKPGVITELKIRRRELTFSESIAGDNLKELIYRFRKNEIDFNIAEALIIDQHKELLIFNENKQPITIKKIFQVILSMPYLEKRDDEEISFSPALQCIYRGKTSPPIDGKNIHSNGLRVYAYDSKKSTLYYIENKKEPIDFLTKLFKKNWTDTNSYYPINKDKASALLEYANQYAPVIRSQPLTKSITFRDVQPIPIISIQNQGRSFFTNFNVLYNKIFVSTHSNDEIMRFKTIEDGIYFVERNRYAENILLEQFYQIIDTTSSICRKGKSWDYPYYEFLFKGDLALFLQETGLPLIDAGFKLTLDSKKKQIIRRPTAVQFTVSSGIDWFKVELYDTIDTNNNQNESERLNITEETLEYGLIKHNAELIFLDNEAIKKLQSLSSAKLKKDGSLLIDTLDFSLIDKLYLIAGENEKLTEQWNLGQQLKNINKMPAINVPKSLKGKLRPYQKTGFQWLALLTNNKLGACLADDMGLGKTIQTIALIQHLQETGNKKPILIIVPVSTLFNWAAEFDKFAPSAEYQIHRGPKREKTIKGILKKQIILVSYATLRNDIKTFSQIGFELIALDEAQAIKNSGSQIFKAVKILQSNRHITITGTPIENSSMELWSQMNFLNPLLLGSRSIFYHNYVKPIEIMGNEEKAKILQQKVAPMILRRTKDLIAEELPAKEEVILYTEMGTQQRKIYNKIRADHLQKIIDVLEKQKADSLNPTTNRNKKNKAMVFPVLMEGMLRLRQACLFPGLLRKEWEDVKSCKLERLKEMLPELSEENHKVLLFSQFTQVLSRLKEKLPYESNAISYLDGSTINRGAVVNDFQDNPDKQLFLISLKAGGTGINLTAADYVFIFDPWWNPAVEAQAIDRAHRIGQDKKVFAYKLKIIELQKRKKDLANSLINEDGASLKKMTDKEILDLFK